jgi:hypothetical protein
MPLTYKRNMVRHYLTIQSRQNSSNLRIIVVHSTCCRAVHTKQIIPYLNKTNGGGFSHTEKKHSSGRFGKLTRSRCSFQIDSADQLAIFEHLLTITAFLVFSSTNISCQPKLLKSRKKRHSNTMSYCP